jgi:hypothetical protein
MNTGYSSNKGQLAPQDFSSLRRQDLPCMDLSGAGREPEPKAAPRFIYVFFNRRRGGIKQGARVRMKKAGGVMPPASMRFHEVFDCFDKDLPLRDPEPVAGILECVAQLFWDLQIYPGVYSLVIAALYFGAGGGLSCHGSGLLYSGILSYWRYQRKA